MVHLGVPYPYDNFSPSLEPIKYFLRYFSQLWKLFELGLETDLNTLQLARIFVMHLYMILQQEIGLTFQIDDGLGILGTRVIAMDNIMLDN